MQVRYTIVVKGIAMKLNESLNITIIGWPDPELGHDGAQAAALAGFAAAISRSSASDVTFALSFDSEFDMSEFCGVDDVASIAVEKKLEMFERNPAAVAAGRKRLLETVSKYIFGPNPARVDDYSINGRRVSVIGGSGSYDEVNGEYGAVFGLGELPELSPYRGPGISQDLARSARLGAVAEILQNYSRGEKTGGGKSIGAVDALAEIAAVVFENEDIVIVEGQAKM